MYVESLKVVGLYGHLNKSLKFHKDYSLLVGINGSGKTTILNIVSWLLRPSIPDLCSTKFKSIEMCFFVGDVKHCIKCTQDNDQLRYEIEVGNRSLEPLVAALSLDPSELNTNYKTKETIRRQYLGLSPEGKEWETWQVIKEIPDPIFLGVDRKTLNSDFEEKDRNRGTASVKETGLDYVSRLLRNAFTQSNARVLTLTEQIKSKLMLHAFDFVYDVNSLFAKKRVKPSELEIDKVKKRVLDLCSTESLEKDEIDKVSYYFEQLKRISRPLAPNKSNSEERLLYFLNIKQFEKVQSILGVFNSFEENKALATKQTDSFLQIMNDFFRDSNKELYFSSASSTVEYRVLDKNGGIVEDGLDIHYLSSGEQQLLILFARVMFESSGHLYIIDEPELSLHVKWLEMLSPYLESVFPTGDQLLIATHSPILADKGRNNAIVLYPY